jgi:predicted phosphoribosyltransferase
MRNNVVFQDRREAGRRLAQLLTGYRNRPEVLVLALPRGGIPVAYEVAHALAAELDVLVVRKLGVPGYSELAMGAVASGGCCYLNEDIIEQMRVPEGQIQTVLASESSEVARREALYRKNRPPLTLKDRVAIVVDDGLATGASMQAAVRAISTQKPREIIIAIPVAPAPACEKLAPQVDRVFCLHTPESFRAVGQWYCDFKQTSDEEVGALLFEAKTAP